MILTPETEQTESPLRRDSQSTVVELQLRAWRVLQAIFSLQYIINTQQNFNGDTQPDA